MKIAPSSYEWREFKDKMHFYTMIICVPCAIGMAIIGIRMNPELTEVPDGYEPRLWEYYRHPVERFSARYLFVDPSLEYETSISQYENEAETKILRKIQRKTEKIMQFYQDHRSYHFFPYFADYYRKERDINDYGHLYVETRESSYLDEAYNPDLTPVPVEGYKPNS